MAGTISSTFVKELIARTNLVDMIGARLSFKKRSGANHFACCPFHQEKTPSFSVNEAQQFYHCFGCGKSGDAISFLMDYENLSFVEAVESLAAQNGLSVEYEERDQSHSSEQVRHAQKAERDLGFACLQAAADFFHQQFYAPTGAQARDYLRQRKLNRNSVEQFLLGYAPVGNALMSALGGQFPVHILLETGLLREKDGQYYDWFRDRVIFPIRNVHGQVIAFGGRSMGDTQPKYLNSPETPWFSKRHECYGLYESLQAERRPTAIMVTEGYMDVVKLHQHGIRHAVATLGTAIGDTHILHLKKRTKKMYFAFDGDAAGHKAAAKALEAAFSQYDEQHQWRFMFMPDGEDPDSLVEHSGIEAIHALMDSSLSASAFLLRLLEAQMQGRDDVEANAEVAHLATQWLEKLPSGAYQSLLREEIRQHFQLTKEAVQQKDDAFGQRLKRASHKQRHVAVTNAVIDRIDLLLSATLYLFPELAMPIRFTDYEPQLAQSLPLTLALIYYIQAVGDGRSVSHFLRQCGQHDVVIQKAETLKQWSAEVLRNDFVGHLHKINTRLHKERMLLEKIDS